MFGNLISEQFAKLLKLRIIGAQRTTETAAKGGSIIILGKTASPVRVYLENVSKVVTFTPYVVRDLAHPVNLGQQFFQENEAYMSFRAKGVQLKIGSSTIHLTASRISLSHANIDSRMQEAINVLKQQGGNFFPAEKNSRLDLCVNEVNDDLRDEVNDEVHHIPSLYQAQTKSVISWHQDSLCVNDGLQDKVNNEVHHNPGLCQEQTKSVLTWHQTRTRIHNTENILLPISVVFEATAGKPGQRKLLPVKHGPVLFLPTKINNLLNSNLLFTYQRDKETFIVSMTNLRHEDVMLPSRCNLSSIAETKSDNTPKANVLNNDPENTLSETELVECRAYIIKTLKRNENEILSQGDTEPKEEIEKDLQRQTNAWVKAEVFKPLTIPRGPAVAPMKKKWSDKWRLAVNNRRLNEATIKDAYPLATIACTIHKLPAVEVFFKLDSAGAVHPMSTRKEDRDLTVFVTPLADPLGAGVADPQGFRVTDPQGSGAADLQGFGAADPQGSVVEDPLGKKLNLNKCNIMMNEVEYLGHLVNHEGIQMIPSYVDHIRDRLNELKKDDKVLWTDTHKVEFNWLKEVFREKPVRGYPGYDRDEPYILDSDWSSTCILSHQQKDQETFLGCTAKKVPPRRTELCPRQGKLAAIRPSLKRVKPLLCERPFNIHADSRCIKILQVIRKAYEMWARRNTYLCSFICKTVQRSGSKQINTDCLSRLPGVPVDDQNTNPFGPINNVVDIYHVNAPVRAKSISLLDLRKAVENVLSALCTFTCVEHHPTKEEQETLMDVEMSCVNRVECPDVDKGILYLISVTANRILPPKRHCLPVKYEDLTGVRMSCLNRIECLEMEESSLYFQGMLANRTLPPRRYCLPGKYYDLAYQRIHCDNISSPRGLSLQAYRRMKQIWFCFYRYQHIQARVNHCRNGIRKITHLPPAKHQFQSEPLSCYGQRIYGGFVGLLTACMYPGNYTRYFLTCQDNRYLIAIPVPDIQATTAVNAMINKWTIHHVVLETLHTDREANDTPSLMEEVMSQLGVMHTFTPASPSESDKEERCHQTRDTVLRSNDCVDAGKTYNSTMHRMTRVSLYEAVCGRTITRSVDMIFLVKSPEANLYSYPVERARTTKSRSRPTVSTPNRGCPRDLSTRRLWIERLEDKKSEDVEPEPAKKKKPAEILIYQDNFLNEKERILHPPFPYSRPEYERAKIKRENETQMCPQGTFSFSLSQGRIVKQWRGPKPQHSTQTRRKKISNQKRTKEFSNNEGTPIRGVTMPPSGEKTGQSPEPDMNQFPLARRLVKPAVIDVKKSIRQIAVETL